MLRSGYKEKQVLEQLHQHRLSAAVDPITENKLLDAGASSGLIATMKAKENVLTELQKIAYDEQQAEKNQQVAQDRSNRLQAAAAEETARQQELQRRGYYQQQTLGNIHQKELQQAQYEQADRNYRAQRQSLEQRIQYLENDINRSRGRGWNESDLRAANQTLDNYKEQLRNLTPPLRPL